MRIAYVSVDPGVSVFGPHGASVHIQEIVREFAAQGHEVTIFTTRRSDLRHRLAELADIELIETTINHAAAVKREQEQWQLRTVGDGPQRVPLMDLAQKLRVDADFRGAVSPSEIPGQLRGSAIGVAPYPETVSAHHYFSPLQVYEYLAAGLPIVASSIGQIPHAVGDAGVLVPGSNASALAQAIDNLVSQSRGMSGWRRHIGHRGHRGRHMRGTAS